MPYGFYVKHPKTRTQKVLGKTQKEVFGNFKKTKLIFNFYLFFFFFAIQNKIQDYSSYHAFISVIVQQGKPHHENLQFCHPLVV